MKDLKGKVAAITGAGSGIGRALAVNLARAGCHLALSDVNRNGLAETVNEARGHGVTVSYQELDVTKRDAVYAWAQTVAQEHGQVNLVINNAGVALSGTVAGLSIEDYEWVMDINFWGVVYGTKAFLPLLEASGEGHIVNISSIFGLTSQPLMSGYNASKFAVRGFTESLRQDLELAGSSVSATCVHPGGIKTNIVRDARISDSVSEVTGASTEAMVADFQRLFFHTPDSAANIIIDGVRKNRRRVLIGADARFYDGLVRVMPTGYQKLFTKAMGWRGRANSRRAQAAAAEK